VKKELLSAKKNQIDFLNGVLWIPDSKTPNGVTEIPLTKLASEAFRNQVAISGNGDFLSPSHINQEGHLKSLRTAWRKALKRAGVSYFRLYDPRSTYATRLSAGGVADEWVIHMLRQGDSQVFKKYSEMKLQMKREALDKINRRANEMSAVLAQQGAGDRSFDTVLTQ
jgi:integrase